MMLRQHNHKRQNHYRKFTSAFKIIHTEFVDNVEKSLEEVKTGAFVAVGDKREQGALRRLR